jgi:hypothetical protein
LPFEHPTRTFNVYTLITKEYLSALDFIERN